MSSASGLDRRPVKRKYENDDEESEEERSTKPTGGGESQDDDSSDQEVCASEETYHASDEPFPIHAAFDAAIKEGTTTASNLIQEAHSKLKEHAPESTTLQNMLKNAEETLISPKPEPPMIGLVGRTGQGKSSTGNAILGVKNLMPTGSDGSSVTNVATIYQWLFPNQKLKYAAKIAYESPEKCRVILEDLLACYKQNLLEAESMEAEDTHGKEQRSEYEMHSQEAIKIFVGLFHGKVGFRNVTEAERTLDQQVASDGALLVEKMLAWCLEYLATLREIDGVYTAYVEADDPADLVNAILPFTADSPGNKEAARWPLVQAVRVGTSESRFLEYVYLVDLPGKSDTNPIRNRTADEYIRKCQGLCVFADISRAVNDPSLHRTISLYAERFPSTFVIALTKIDLGVNDGLLQSMRREREDMSEYDRLTGELSRLNSELHEENQKVTRPGRKSAKYRLSMYERIEDLGKEITETENKQFGELVSARNRHTTKLLVQDKQKYFKRGGTLQVVHVSPEHYEVHTSPSARRRCPLMDVTLTGIPGLRDVGLMMAAQPLWKAQTEYLESKVFVFIHGLRLWSAGCAVQDQTQLLSIVADLSFKEADSPLDKLVTQRESIMETKFLQPLRTFREDARDGALSQLAQLEKWNTRSWISFYRHSGQHTTGKKAATSWNETFMQCQTLEMLDPCWHEMVSALQDTFSEAKNQVFASVEETKKKLMKSPASVSLDRTDIEGLFKGALAGLQSDYDMIVENFKQSTLDIKMDATKDRIDSFFTVAMEPAYEKGRLDHGTGVTQRCKQNLRDHLSLDLTNPREPFAVHHQKLAKALKENSSNHVQALQTCVQARCSQLYSKFGQITQQKPETPAEASARQVTKPFLDRALLDIEKIKTVLDQVRQKYPSC